MPIEPLIAIAVDFIVPEAVATAVIDGTTFITEASTGALVSLGVPADIAAGAVTVAGDAALGGAVGAGLGAGQAALTNEDILKGALMGGAGGAVGLGFGNLAEKGIAEQAAKIFSSSTAKAIGSTLGQAAGGFTGGLASGANLKDSATMAALGAAIGAYSSSEIEAANAAKIANDKQVIAKGLLDKANAAITTAETDRQTTKYWLDRYNKHWNDANHSQDAAAQSEGFYNYHNDLAQYNASLAKQNKSTPIEKTATEAYLKSFADFEAAKIEYEKAAAGFTDSQTGLVGATEKEVAYERTAAPAISDKTTSAAAGGEFKPAGEGITADKQLGKEVTTSAEKVKPEEPLGGTKTSKTGSNISKALDIVQLLPVSSGATGSFGGGGGAGTPTPQGGLTSTATPGPGSSALAQVLNQGGAGAPVFGTQEDKGKKSKWNIASLRYMGNQDKGA